MKFVKGDAIAGLIICAINLVAGFAIGVLRAGMPAFEALELYATLTIGDALVAQVSALVITLAAGLLVTRVDPRDARHSIGDVLKLELFSSPKVLAVASGSMFLMGLAPGLPMLPFFLAGAVGAAWASRLAFFPQKAADQRDPQAALQHNLQNRVEAAKKQKALSDQLAPTVVPITVDLGPGLSAALGFGKAGEDPVLVRDYVPQLRDALYFDTGVRFPGIRFRPSSAGVADHAFVVRIDDVPVLEERLFPDRSLATATPEQLRKLGIEAEPQRHPISGATMALIASSDKALATAAGITVWEAPGLVCLSLAAVLRRRAANFLGIQEVSDLVERLEKAYPALVKEVVPKITSLPQLLGVLRRLVDEGVSIRNLRAIIEALSEHGTRDGDPVWLTEKVRAALGAQLAHSYAGMGHSLPVVLLDPLLEDTVRAGICTTADGHTLALEPEVAKEVVISVVRSLEPMLARGKRPIVLTQTSLRRFVRKLLEVDLPAVAVLGFDELPADLSIQPMGRACLPS
jgi:type III secretion protein V